VFNRAILFSTSAPSFHGFPRPLACPPGDHRNSIALYYLTPPRHDAPARSKALYVAAPGEPYNAELERLRTLRAIRRLQPADLLTRLLKLDLLRLGGLFSRAEPVLQAPRILS